MKKRMITFLSALSICFIFSGCEKEENYGQVELPEMEKIEQVQLGSMRITVGEDYPQAKAEKLVSDLEKAPLVNKKQRKGLDKGKDYWSVGVVAKNGEKQMFYFFQNGEDWYFETEDGRLYSDGDFVTEHMESCQKMTAPVLIALVENEAIHKIYFELMQELEPIDMRFLYVTDVMKNIKYKGYSEEKAIELAEYEAKDLWINNKYAEMQGYKLSDEKLAEAVELYAGKYKERDYYKNIGEQIYKDYGLTVEESIEKGHSLIEAAYFRNKIQKDRKNEFYDGKDIMGDKKCRSWEEYYGAFVEDVMIPEVEKEGMEEFEEMMEQAKEFYEANRERLQEMMETMDGELYYIGDVPQDEI